MTDLDRLTPPSTAILRRSRVQVPSALQKAGKLTARERPTQRLPSGNDLSLTECAIATCVSPLVPQLPQPVHQHRVVHLRRRQVQQSVETHLEGGTHPPELLKRHSSPGLTGSGVPAGEVEDPHLQVRECPFSHAVTIPRATDIGTIADMTDPAPGTPAGWYHDPKKRPVYWTGTGWDFKARPPADGAVVVGVTSPGWYPHGANGQTYWDGQRWTDQHAPLPPQRNNAAIASLVLALVAFVVAFFGGLIGLGISVVLILCGIAAGIDGLGRAKRTNDAGQAMSTVGLVLCLLPVIVLVISNLR